VEPERKSDFEREAGAEDPGIVREFVAFLSENKRWWLIPIVLTLALVGGLMFLGSGPLAPFVYTLF